MPPEPVMLSVLVGATLVATFVATKGKDWSSLHNQDAWTCMILLIGLAFFAPTIPMGILIGVIGFGMMWVMPGAIAASLAGWRTLMFAALYLFFLRFVDPWMIPAFLGLMLTLGAGIELRNIWNRVFNRDPDLRTMNANNTHMLSAMCVACGVALAIDVNQAWPIPLIMIAATPIVLTGLPWKAKTGQGWGHFVVIGFAAATVLYGWHVWAFGLPIIALCLALAWNDGGFTVRRLAQGAVIRFVWKQGWRYRIFGNGMSSWRTLQGIRIPSGPSKGSVMPDAHNEPVHMFGENGMIGVVALCAVLIDVAMRLDGEPLLIPGLALCSIAMVNNPWTLTRWLKIPPHLNHKYHVTWYGSPAITMISFTLMVLIDGVYV